MGFYMVVELEWFGYQVQGISCSLIVGCEYVIVDILDCDVLVVVLFCIQFQVVVYLVGVLYVVYCDVLVIYQVNIMGMCNLFDVLVELDMFLYSVVLFSSVYVYGVFFSELFIEQLLMVFFNDYVISKVVSEYVVCLYMDWLLIMVMCLFNYIGVGQLFLFFVVKVIDYVWCGSIDLWFGNLDVEWDFIDVCDLVCCYGMLIEQCCCGDVVNICSGVFILLCMVIDIVSELFGLDFVIESDLGLICSYDVDWFVGFNVCFMVLIGGIIFWLLWEILQWMFDV